MPKQIFIAYGNHATSLGIREIVHSLLSSLKSDFSIELTRELKSNCVNILIDEFSHPFDVAAIKKTKELYPKTRIVIAATEFVTPIKVFGVEIAKTFDFFENPAFWMLFSRNPTPILKQAIYLRRRYLGFVGALKYCDLLAAVHPHILPSVSELLDQFEIGLPAPVSFYPQIGSLSAKQLERLWNLPVGFTMSGTPTPYRNRITASLIRNFKRVGWTTPIYKYLPFEPANDTVFSTDTGYLAEYRGNSPDYLFNINPPQSANWPYSSPMRILRAILLGQIPVITKRFYDHPLEDVAMLWDGKKETAFELATRQIFDRQPWLTDYIRSIEAYDQQTREANKPFVSAMKAIVEGVPVAMETGSISERRVNHSVG